MIARLMLAALAAAGLGAQDRATPEERPAPADAIREVEVAVPKELPEEVSWRELMRDAGTSPLDYVRSLELYLERFPETKRRPEIERALVQRAIENNDRRRLLEYGLRVVEREPANLLFVEHVIRALLDGEDGARSKKALELARQFEVSLRVLELNEPTGGTKRVLHRQRLDAGFGKALVFQARAAGNLGEWEAAAALAAAAFERNPTAEAAREAGRWLARLGRDSEALERYADAFAIEDPDATAELRLADRRRLAELHQKLYGSERGLGDRVLQAYDRTTARLAARREALKKLDPNFGLRDPLQFRLSGPSGEIFEMASLKGKVVVLDFWATWCQPCRTQQPLYEEAQARYAGRSDVVFLSLSTDTNREVVAPFLKKTGWNKRVYFEDGLQGLFQVTNIPTTVLLDRQGAAASRMIGFDPDRFVALLTERIDRLLAEPPPEAR